MKKTLSFFLFILIFPLFAQDFSFDDWLSLYEEGFFGETEELPGEYPLFIMDTLGLRFVIEEESKEEEESSLINNDAFNLRLINREDKDALSGERDIPVSMLITKEEAQSEELPLAEDALSSEGFFDETVLFFEGPPLIIEAPAFEIRSFNRIFPNLTPRQRSAAMSRSGLRYYFKREEYSRINPAPDSEIDIQSPVLNRNPSHIIESLIVVPFNNKEFDLLDIYNALGRIEKIKDYPVPLNGSNFYVFTESTRITSNRNRRAVPDPLPADKLPFTETIYLRLKENTIGNLFLRGDISISVYGITYNMTNFADVRYFLLPVMKAERFSTILYLEPVKEGVLIYCMAGFYIPNFVADRVNLTPNINRRIDVFINWITDGLRQQEGIGSE